MKKRVIIIPAVVIAGIALVGIGAASMKNTAISTNTASTYLEKKTLSNSISVTGTVESTNNTKIFSTLNYSIDSVNVNVGDKVKKGDVLCTLNTDELQNQILQQQAVVDSNNISSNYQLTDAEKNYQDAYTKYNDGTNSQIVAAKQALDNAKLSLDIAQNNYDNAVNGNNTNKDTQIRSAELALSNAEESVKYYEKNYETIKNEVDSEDYYTIKDKKQALDDARKLYDEYIIYLTVKDTIWIEYEEAKTVYEKAKKEIDDANKAKLDTALQSLQNAQQTLESAKLSLETAKNSSKTSDKDYKNQLTNAQLAYENAKNSYNLALKEAEANVASLKALADRERTLSGNNDSQLILLESYKSKLDYAVITAPCDGTITVVNAVAGSLPTNELFVIEDTESLKITAPVSEYDITSIELGMPITIKSDAIKGVTYEGTITQISPVAKKDETGKVSFDIEVTVLSQDTDLKIGMTAKLNIITEEIESAYAVMYDMITIDEEENDIIYIAEKTDSGYKATALNVTVGIETDFEVEIISDKLFDGMIVLNNPESLSDGDVVFIEEEPVTDE